MCLNSSFRLPVAASAISPRSILQDNAPSPRSILQDNAPSCPGKVKVAFSSPRGRQVHSSASNIACTRSLQKCKRRWRALRPGVTSRGHQQGSQERQKRTVLIEKEVLHVHGKYINRQVLTSLWGETRGRDTPPNNPQMLLSCSRDTRYCSDTFLFGTHVFLPGNR